MIKKEEVAGWFKTLQDEICSGLSDLDGGAGIEEDLWERPGGGGGRTRIIQGDLIEKGGVNFSAVHGATPEKILKALQTGPGDFYATGISIVLHPSNPWVPIIHMNLRYFEMESGAAWFGGGIDLTPHYVDEEQARYFHQTLKNVCDRHDSGYYSEFKRWADEYFFIKHRNETRGVGGIFFDRLAATEKFSAEARFAFVRDVGEAFLPLYSKLALTSRNKPYGDAEKNWQALRRGRYVEFNLVWDKGTKFGLDTGGRTESILMSLPPQAAWTYDHTPAPGSKEQKTLQLLKKDIDWLKS